MMHSQVLRRALLSACASVPLILDAPLLAQAPSAPPAAPALDPAVAASKSAFERLDEVERKAIQNELIWTGDFNGVAGGEFGKRTYDAMLSFERRTRSPASDGILNPAERSALQRDAKAARDGQRWTQVRDDKTGVSLGLPMAVLTQKVAVELGQVYRSADGAVSVEMASIRNTEAGALQTLFDQLRADKPGRKVTYRLSRPDWFVVSGEEGPRRFYTRIASGPAGLRGYTFRFPAADAARYERLMIAMANSFEPFPGTGVAANPANVPATVTTAATTTAPAAVVSKPVANRVLLSAIRIAPGKLATSASGFAACKEARLGNDPIAASAVTREGELVMIAMGSGQGPVATAVPPAGNGAAGRKVYAISFDQSGGTLRAVMTAGTMAVAGSGAPARIQAALQSGAAGAPVFSEDGGLVGLVSAAPRMLKSIAGVTPVASYPVIAAPWPAQPAAAQSLATRAQAVVAIDCAV